MSLAPTLASIMEVSAVPCVEVIGRLSFSVHVRFAVANYAAKDRAPGSVPNTKQNIRFEAVEQELPKPMALPL